MVYTKKEKFRGKKANKCQFILLCPCQEKFPSAEEGPYVLLQSHRDDHGPDVSVTCFK